MVFGEFVIRMVILKGQGMMFLSFRCPTLAHDVTYDAFLIKGWAKSSIHPSCNCQEPTLDCCEEEETRSLLNTITNSQTVSVLLLA